MGISGISVWQLAIIALIVIMLFGSRRLGALGGDLGTAIKGFRQSIKDEPAHPADSPLDVSKEGTN